MSNIPKLIHFNNIDAALEKLKKPLPRQLYIEDRKWDIDSIKSIFTDATNDSKTNELREKAEDFFLDLCLAKEVREILLKNELNRFFLAAYYDNSDFKEGVKDFLNIHGDYIYRNIFEGKEILIEIMGKQLYELPQSLYPIYQKTCNFIDQLPAGPYKNAVLVIISYLTFCFHETTKLTEILVEKNISVAVKILHKLELVPENRNIVEKYIRSAHEEDKIYQEKMNETFQTVRQYTTSSKSDQITGTGKAVLTRLWRYFSMPNGTESGTLDYIGEENIIEKAEISFIAAGISKDTAKYIGEMYKKHFVYVK